MSINCYRIATAEVRKIRRISVFYQTQLLNNTSVKNKKEPLQLIIIGHN